MATLKGFGSVPFQPTSRGYIPIKEDAEVVKANLITLINTYEGERVMMPEYGSTLDRLLFSPNTESLHNEIAEVISDLIERWEPSIVVNNLIVEKPSSSTLTNEKDLDHIVYIRIDFSMKEDLSTSDNIEVLIPTA